ncbi:MAG TPA: lysophospholipid acyltransferase family protein [Bacteroidota bacterium]|nr:lysophospholipid acyltransferase family protein [Bacteroidota bacterium]
MILASLKLLVAVVVTMYYSILAIGSALVDSKGSLYHGIARTWARALLRIFGVRVHVSGLENLEPGRTYVYVSNHASMFDIPAVIAGIPDEIRIVYKKELAYVPIWGWSLAVGHYVAIDRFSAKDAMKSLDAAAEKIRNGASVLLFAEGTRTRTGKLQPFKRGAFTLASKAEIPVVPLTINNSFNILPKGSIRIRRADIALVVDKPIPTTGLGGRSEEMNLMESVRSVIAAHYVDQG